MRGVDLDRERSEKKLSLKEFSICYNEGLPEGYPPVTVPLLKTFSVINAHSFKEPGVWSLDQHRKKVMDWLPSYLHKSEREQ
ncbi:MAG TPA: hypothetical protein VN086_00855 [Candidatus Paceibacterota bacterium]|nr:hypothetical protein [Candidatus Paceibacterota bacterium]